MDIKKIAEMFSEQRPGVLVLDEVGNLFWIDERAQEWLGVGLASDKALVVKTLEEKRSYINVKREKLELEGSSYTVLFLKNLQDFRDSEVRLFCYEKILDSINDGIVMSDYDGKVILYNRAQEKLEDLKGSMILGKYLWEAYNYTSPESSEHREVFKSGIAKTNLYKAHSYSNGLPKYVSYSTYPLFYQEEKIGVYSISKNETELQELLAETMELKRHFRQLEKAQEAEEEKSNGTMYDFSDIMGVSQSTKDTIGEAEDIAMLENNVLIIGETGTGKEVFAQSMHNFSKKKSEPFIAVNCGAIPENLMESILFGSVKGSYTGATNQIGLFEKAEGGALFLDELNSMPLNMQTKLLRVLQERKIRKVGGLDTIPIKCRVMCAINENPKDLIEKGRLRQDLFYRIAGLCLYIEPLRERKDDIICLAEYFGTRAAKLLGKRKKACSEGLKDLLISHSWPGNIRELEHVMENIVLRTKDSSAELLVEDLPGYLLESLFHENLGKQERTDLNKALSELESRIIIAGLKKNNFNVTRTAEELGIIRQSLLYRMKKLGIEKQKG